MSFKVLKAAALAASTLLASSVHAATWHWSFAGEAGTFETGGDGSPGSYVVSDFAVTASAVGGAIGRQSGGVYESGGFETLQPYGFDWNGSAVTAWRHEGPNSFDWLVYSETAAPLRSYLFGWAAGNVNDVSSAAYLVNAVGGGSVPAGGPVSVALVVPEPRAYALMLGGLAIVGLRTWRLACSSREKARRPG